MSLRHRIDCATRSFEGESLPSVLAEYDADVNWVDEYDHSLLMLAAGNGSKGAVQFLITQGVMPVHDIDVAMSDAVANECWHVVGLLLDAPDSGLSDVARAQAVYAYNAQTNFPENTCWWDHAYVLEAVDMTG